MEFYDNNININYSNNNFNNHNSLNNHTNSNNHYSSTTQPKNPFFPTPNTNNNNSNTPNNPYNPYDHYNTFQKHNNSQSIATTDYNYPTAKRTDTMYLQTITTNPITNTQLTTLKKFKQLNTARDYSANLFNLDIDGSSPRRLGQLSHKIDYTNRNDDIERSSPKTLFYSINTAKDPIELSTASTRRKQETRCSKHIISKHVINPLEPKYQLPGAEWVEPVLPKFIRDSINCRDIEGCYPKKRFKRSFSKEMPVFKMDKIDGSSPGKMKERGKDGRYDYFDYSDVTDSRFRSKRCVNPLDPVYEVKYDK